MRKSLKIKDKPHLISLNTLKLPPHENHLCLSESIKNLLDLSNKVLEDEKNNSPLNSFKKLAWHVQEFIRTLSLYTHILEPTPENQKKIQHMAFYDNLTGLPNRQFFELYAHQLHQSFDNTSLFYLVFLDLDKFKKINDTYGHEMGDILLKKVADRLKKNLRAKDFIARFGGDEFAIILRSENQENLNLILKRILFLISQPYVFGNLHLKISASLGVSLYPKTHKSLETVLKKADQAMYKSKSRGNNLYTLDFE